jgi:hypothetical protein
MERVLAAARSAADVVLVSVDSIQNALAVVDSACELLLVASRNRATSDAAAAAALALRNAQLRPLGLVVTNADPKRSPSLSG